MADINPVQPPYINPKTGGNLTLATDIMRRQDEEFRAKHGVSLKSAEGRLIRLREKMRIAEEQAANVAHRKLLEAKREADKAKRASEKTERNYSHPMTTQAALGRIERALEQILEHLTNPKPR